MKRVIPSQASIRFFERVYFKACQKALMLTAQTVIDRADTTPPESLKYVVSNLKADHIEDFLKDCYKQVGKRYSIDTARKLALRKSDDEAMWDEWWTRYAAERSKRLAGQILTTYQANINLIIDRTVQRLTDEGLGIAEMAGRLQRELTTDMMLMQKWEAQRIAQTEVIGTANRGSFEGAKSTGLDVKKFWIANVDSKIRESHLAYQRMEPQAMDYEYAPGLQYPGGPNGSAEEVINCRCSIGYV